MSHDPQLPVRPSSRHYAGDQLQALRAESAALCSQPGVAKLLRDGWVKVYPDGDAAHSTLTVETTRAPAWKPLRLR